MPVPMLFELVLAFEHGRIHLRDLDGDMELLDYRGKLHESRAIVRSRARGDQMRASFEKSIGAYLDAVRQDASPPVPGMAGLLGLQFEAGLKRSIAQQRPVQVQQEFSVEM